MSERERDAAPREMAEVDALRTAAWQAIVSAVFEGRDDWRRAVSEATGLPFTRVRVLRRVEHGPRSLSEVAAGAGLDAPAASVAVSALEERGYVVRESAPHDRRVKYVTITDAGRELLARVRAVDDPAPPGLHRASAEQLRTIIDLLAGGDAASDDEQAGEPASDGSAGSVPADPAQPSAR